MNTNADSEATSLVPISRPRAAHERSAASRHARTALMAYSLSEMRRFAPGHSEADWLLAEQQVDALIAVANAD